MSTDSEVVEGELVPYDPTAAAPATLFGTSDPRVALERMSDLAKVLVDLVRNQGLAVRISGREHLRVEAWRALGGMVGVHPITAWSRPNETNDGYVVRVEARTRTGELVGASEAECSRAESTWSRRDAYAVRAMAETRATSRALRGPLGQIVVLAGYEPAGAEEIPDGDERARPQGTKTNASFSPPADSPIPAEIRPTAEQKDQIVTLVRTLAGIDPGTDWKARCVEITGAPWDHTTTTMAAGLIRQLEQALAAAGEDE